MATQTGSGSSTLVDTRAAAQEAVRRASLALRQKPKLGVLFASSKHPLKLALEGAKAAADGVEFIGCHTAGEFTERGLTRGGLVVLLIATDTVAFDVAMGMGVKNSHQTAAKDLCARFATAAQDAGKKQLSASTTVLLVDGLAGTGERLVREVMQRTRGFQQVVGGAAGDDGNFKVTEVGARTVASADVAVAAHAFDKRQWGIGVDHGLRPRTKRMTVTKASGSVLHEIDGKPAFETYKAFAAERGVALEPATAGKFLIGNELGVFFLDQLHHARAPVGVGPKGELNLVADIEEGSNVCILDGEPESMVAACGRAAAEAKANLRGAQAAGVLVFDCVCRGMILGDGFSKEIAAIREVFPDTPIAGFLTYGEIARFSGRLDGWHNTTTVVTAIPA